MKHPNERTGVRSVPRAHQAKGCPLANQQQTTSLSQTEASSTTMPRAESNCRFEGDCEAGSLFRFIGTPTNVIERMDQEKRQRIHFVRSRRRLWRGFALLLPAGLPFVLVNLVTWDSRFNFGLVAYGLWCVALVGLIGLRRSWPFRRNEEIGSVPHENAGTSEWIIGVLLGVFCLGYAVLCVGSILGYQSEITSLVLASPCCIVVFIVVAAVLVFFIAVWLAIPTGGEVDPRLDVTRAIVDTLRDDVAPQHMLSGWLDLTGALGPNKVIRQHRRSSGMPIAFYRDDWLRARARLGDGNFLKVSAVERVKAKLGRWRYGTLSGRQEWKKGGVIWRRHKLKVTVIVNPMVYDVLPLQHGRADESAPRQERRKSPRGSAGTGLLHQRETAGGFMIEAKEVGGCIRLVAKSNEAVSAQGILQVLHFAYRYLRPRDGSQMVDTLRQQLP